MPLVAAVAANHLQPPLPVPSCAVLDPQLIAEAVNAAQRKTTFCPPPVVAMGGGDAMVAPQIQYHLPLQNMAPGPNIKIPQLSWHGPNPQSGAGSTVGYSSNHANYMAEHECQAKLVYAPPPAEMISLEISALHEGGQCQKACGTMVEHICEGKKDIDAHIDAPSLISIALTTILPKLHEFGGAFIWQPEEFVVCDSQ
ncbi:hypothetical protein BKA82DRAFT_21281 [Pisolithus tinctorius]|uniref:Uncharacterized protein n=1 Tax=Pisolithus tinctorius Marx 270 TaxID=870435 RepID=A0A0C3PNA0_PISTI|nr:hypothetical protein BKA82DRAFT_21281 [Pisolithus tinctorius]KIO10311.1 hypothetical protein M404DRAFT_21281 [Pisolithus tinctorius Marx 270]